MRTLLVLFALMFVGCGATVQGGSGSSSKPGNSSHQIDQLDQGDNDGGVDLPAVDPASSLDSLRIAVAYCAAAIMDKQPNHCEILESTESKLQTECDTGLSITWNCERCGQVEKGGQIIGHVLMTSDTRFEVTQTTTKAGHVCTLAANGHEFTVSTLQ